MNIPKILLIIFVIFSSVYANERNYFLGGSYFERLIIYPDLKTGQLKYPYLDLYDNIKLKGKPIISISRKGVTYKDKIVCLSDNENILIQNYRDEKYKLDYNFLTELFKAHTGNFKESNSMFCDIQHHEHLENEEDLFPPIGKCKFLKNFLYIPSYCKNRNKYFELLFKTTEKKNVSKVYHSKGIFYAELSSLKKQSNIVHIPLDKKLKDDIFLNFSKIKRELIDFKKCISNYGENRSCLDRYLQNKNYLNYLKEHLYNPSIETFHNDMSMCESKQQRTLNKCFDVVHKLKGERYVENMNINCVMNHKKKFSLSNIKNGISKRKLIDELLKVRSKINRFCLEVVLPEKSVKNRKTLNQQTLDQLSKVEEGRIWFKINANNKKYLKDINNYSNGTICITRNSYLPTELVYTKPFCNYYSNDEFNFSLCFEMKNRKMINSYLDIECVASPSFFKDFLELRDNRVYYFPIL